MRRKPSVKRKVGKVGGRKAAAAKVKLKARAVPVSRRSKLKAAQPNQPAGQFRVVNLDVVDAGPDPAGAGAVGRDDRYKPASLRELGESLKVGQLQPIGVHEREGKMTLVWGRRRLLAAREVGLPTLGAIVYSGLSDDVLARLHATENVQRREWNPIEEADVVANLLQAADKEAVESLVKEGRQRVMTWDCERWCINRVAEQLGKSVSWVAERSYLAKLSGRSRKLVLQGRLPVAHALQVARLADPEERDKLAEGVASADGREALPLRILKERVEGQLHDLGKVPWKLSLPVAGKPACDECPSNTANQAGLFDGGKPRATCTDPACFAVKEKLVNREIKKVVNAAASEAEENGDVRPTERCEFAIRRAFDRMPEAIDPRTVKQQVEAAVGAWTPKPTEQERETAKADRERATLEAKTEEAKRMAGFELAQFEQERGEALYAELVVRVKGTEGLRSVLLMISHTSAWRDLGEHDEKVIARGRRHLPTLVAALLKPAVSDELLSLEKLMAKSVGLPVSAHDLLQHGVVDEFAAALGVELKPRKTLEDFLSVEFGGKVEAAATAGAGQ